MSSDFGSLDCLHYSLGNAAMAAESHWELIENIPMLVLPDHLCPRFSLSSVLTLQSLDRLEFRERRVLDLGTGSGALGLVALAREAGWVGFSDIDPTCVNAVRLSAGLSFDRARWEVREADGIKGWEEGEAFDVVFANYPIRPTVPDRWAAEERGQASRTSLVDPEHRAFRELFECGARLLRSRGQVVFTLADFANRKELLGLCAEHGWRIEVLRSAEINGCNYAVYAISR